MRVAILTISDRSSRGERPDASGPALAKAVEGHGATVVSLEVLPDERRLIETALRRLAVGGEVDVVLTTGGTGVGPRDVTPEATLAVLDKRLPGMAEAMRARSLEVTPHAMLSRAEAGVARACLIINLPGSPKGAVECFAVVAGALGHAIDLISGRQPE
jgi:molybdenum cofactor synthesis domain-containing protein